MSDTAKTSFVWAMLILGAFLPRLIVSDNFFIQDEQPWINRSQLYVNSLFAGDLNGAARYPLSNHPAIPLMTVVGPAMNMYGAYHGLSATYESWSLDHKREAAVWARYAWGIACSVVLLGLYACLVQLSFFAKHKTQAAIAVILFGLEPWIWGISRSVSVDVLMAIGVVGAFITSGVAREKNKSMWYMAAGAWWGLAFISKSPALITMPLMLLVACLPSLSLISKNTWKEIGRRLGLWIGGAYGAMAVLWPPFIIHPIERLLDVLARAQLHAEVPEVYYWPGLHLPFFFFLLSAFATVGLLLYIVFRIREWRRNAYIFSIFDALFFAGIFHGIVLVLLQGDHARKNLPAVALLAFVGIIGWIYLLRARHIEKLPAYVGLIFLQLILVGPYFPHVISAYNLLFAYDTAGKRLLVDVGNGSRLVADYINSHDAAFVYAVPMDSLIQPYLDGPVRGSLRSLPSEGKLQNLPSEVTHVVVPFSAAARTSFDTTSKGLLEAFEGQQPQTILRVRDVSMFAVYRLR